MESISSVDDDTLDEALALYRAVGRTAYSEHRETLRAALAGSSRVVVARRGGRWVGLARVVSDGATIAYLQDVLVQPRLQRTGLGRSLVTAALEGFTEAAASRGGPLRAFIRLDG